MFNCTALFLALSVLSQPIPIKLGDGKIIMSTLGGPTQLPTTNLTFYALYVPAFKVSLLSVSCLDLSGLRATFENKICTIHRIHNNNPILTGYLDNGIYIHNTRVHSSLESSAFTAINTTTGSLASSSSDIWHRRLGYINYGYLKPLFPKEQL